MHWARAEGSSCAPVVPTRLRVLRRLGVVHEWISRHDAGVGRRSEKHEEEREHIEQGAADGDGEVELGADEDPEEHARDAAGRRPKAELRHLPSESSWSWLRARGGHRCGAGSRDYSGGKESDADVRSQHQPGQGVTFAQSRQQSPRCRSARAQRAWH